MNRSVQAKPAWDSNNYMVHKKEEVPDIWGDGIPTRNYFVEDREEDLGHGKVKPPMKFEDTKESLTGEEETYEPHETPPNIQNAGTGGFTGIGPPTNQNTQAATGPHPQAAYTQEFNDEEKKQQVIQQNEADNRARQHDNKEGDSGIEQPRAAGAAASMASYPDSSMQMMEKAWGSGPDTYAQDALHRGGDKDISDDEEDIDEDEKEDGGWIPEDESKVKAEKEWLNKFESLHKNFVEKGEINPILSTLLALDND
jgi:hypothetical protein